MSNWFGTLASVGDKTDLRRLLDKLPVGAYTCDPDGLITYYNKHAVELWGRAPKINDTLDRFCGSFKLYAADGTPISHDQCWMALAIKNKQEYNGQEIIVERSDGYRMTVLAHASPMLDAEGNLIGAMNVLIDITDRKRGEAAQTQLAAIVASSDDAIISKTLEGRIVSWNVGAERLFGFTAAEAIGQRITMIIPPDRHDEETMILSRIRAGERIDHYETIRVGKSGRRIDISVSISPLRDSTGRIIGASKVARDITLRKRADEALVALKDELADQLSDLRRLHEMSTRLATMRDLMPILEETLRTAAAVQGTDLGMLMLFNAEKGELELGASVGFSEEFLQIVHDLPPGTGACWHCVQTKRRVIVADIEGDPMFAGFQAEARSAGFRAVHSTPLITRGGEVVGALTTHFRKPRRPTEREMRVVDLCVRHAVDFIENAQLYAQLCDADRAKNVFLATLAHELRNPLAPIRNALSFLNMKGPPTPELKSAREIIGRQLGQLTRLVDDLLDVARITQNKLQLRKERVELSQILQTAVETSRPLIESCGQRLNVNALTQTLYLESDLTRIAQAISNLLNNAAKYSERGSTIWLSAMREGSDAVISVRDNGIGIPRDMLPRVFEMFTQMTHPIERSQGGLGIGLTLVKRLVEMHGGTVAARSEGLGQGSEFIIRLPLAIEHSRSARPSEPKEEAANASLRVLVVDDNRDAAESLSMLLEVIGNETRMAHDGPEAIVAAEEFRPAAILLDIGLPELNGYEVARKIREQPWGKSIFLIAVTGWGQDEDRQRSSDAGFDQHLVKPVDLDVLRELLGALKSGEAPSAPQTTSVT